PARRRAAARDAHRPAGGVSRGRAGARRDRGRRRRRLRRRGAEQRPRARARPGPGPDPAPREPARLASVEVNVHDFLSRLARLLGIPVEEGTELRLELASFPSGGMAVLVLALCAGALWLVFWLYRRHRGDLGRGRRLLLAALRALAVLLAVLVLFEPSLVAVKREVRPGQAILLLDASQSMGHVDAWRRDEVQDVANAWRALGVADPASSTRLELAKALL